jgi:hypothetical protein
MAYDGVRSYLGTSSLAAQNVVMTASGAIAPGTAVSGVIVVGEPTWLVGITGYVTATPSAFPAGVKPYVIVGTTTSTGNNAYAQSSASCAYSTFNPPIALPGNSGITLGLVATGTANATQTLGGTSFLLSVAPQFT